MLSAERRRLTRIANTILKAVWLFLQPPHSHIPLVRSEYELIRLLCPHTRDSGVTVAYTRTVRGASHRYAVAMCYRGIGWTHEEYETCSYVRCNLKQVIRL